MIARLALSTVALACVCRRDGAGPVLRAYRVHLATQRCRRLLARSDAAREAGDRAGAEAWLTRATGALRQAEQVGTAGLAGPLT